MIVDVLRENRRSKYFRVNSKASGDTLLNTQLIYIKVLLMASFRYQISNCCFHLYYIINCFIGPEKPLAEWSIIN